MVVIHNSSNNIGFVTNSSCIIKNFNSSTNLLCKSNISHFSVTTNKVIQSVQDRYQPHNHSSYHPCMVAKKDTNNETTPIQSTQINSQYSTVDIQTTTSDTISSNGVDHNHQNEPSQDTSKTDYRLIVAGIVLGIVLFGTGIAAGTGYLGPDTLVRVASWFEQLGPSAIFLYAGLYFVLELIAVPAIPLTLGSGYLFGVLKGTIAVSISSTAAAGVSFLIAKYGLRDSISKLASQYPKFRAMDRAIAREGFKFVFLLRLSPLLPFSISNYLYGLTSVGFTEFMLGSWLGMFPGTIAYVSAGAAVNALTEIGNNKEAINPFLIGIGVLATIAALGLIAKIAGEAIQAVDDEEEIAHN